MVFGVIGKHPVKDVVPKAVVVGDRKVGVQGVISVIVTKFAFDENAVNQGVRFHFNLVGIAC